VTTSLHQFTNGLDFSRLQKAKNHGGKVIAQCPACAAAGADKSGEHLVIFEEGQGKWGCIAFPGDKQHRREIAALVGASDTARGPLPILPLRKVVRPEPRTLQLPELRFPTLGELIRLTELRGLFVFAGLERAARAGMLHCATMRDAGESVETWVLTDSARRSAQARRLDGKPWHINGSTPKAKTLPGSQAAWPIGAADIGSRPFVALCEGGPDTLCAWTLAWWHGRSAEIAPVCMTGAGNGIHPDALHSFEGRGIWTFPHHDAAGERAQARWTAELIGAGASWVKPFDVTPHKDLNEFLTAVGAQLDDVT